MSLRDYYFEQINPRLDFLTSIGFSHEEIVFITCNNPYVFFYSNDAIQSKIEAIGSCGYLLEDVLKMMRNFPLLFGYDSNTIKEKFQFYQDLNIDSILIDDTRYLFFPLDLIKARVHYFHKKEIEISPKNSHALFLDDTPFYKRYHITRDELLKGEY